MDKHVRETLFDFCNFFDVISRKSISRKQLSRLQEEIVVILCELEIYFPPAFCDICVHLLVHIVEDIIHLGPAFLHNMMPFERMNGFIKGFVRNRARPEGSIVTAISPKSAYPSAEISWAKSMTLLAYPETGTLAGSTE